ncbi:hypothetical protein [Herbaspirillum huttiense]|uniref:hypothetical protein n=1 Tax=Herbaspirillum huttiense TaxID=863372 RepID=UPI00034929CC|nr:MULTISPECIES: hypothetical protein [Herbaspirillum]UWE16329.1 hypothetical protein NY669_25200 [Herbaspirillum huttiense]
MRISFRTLSALCSIATIGTLAVFASAFSQSAYAASASELDQALSPHRAMVRTALAPRTGSVNDSGNTMQLASNSESPSCRSLRMQAERARTGDPSNVQRAPVPGTWRDGRFTMNGPGNIEYGERARIESRYMSECR